MIEVEDLTHQQEVRAVTKAFKELDVVLAAGAGHSAGMLAACHVGLGARMLHDLGMDTEEVVNIVREAIEVAKKDVD